MIIDQQYQVVGQNIIKSMKTVKSSLYHKSGRSRILDTNLSTAAV